MLFVIILLPLQSIFENTFIMYAIVEIAGKQFKVTQDQFVYAPKMEGEEGASVEFDPAPYAGRRITLRLEIAPDTVFFMRYANDIPVMLGWWGNPRIVLRPRGE